MYKETLWYQDLIRAEKTCLKEDTIKKILYIFRDGRQMVEEWNTDTQVLLRRAWKVKGFDSKFDGTERWEVELGEPLPNVNPDNDDIHIMECKDEPVLVKRNTRKNIEWRVKNVPYSIDNYSVDVNKEERCLVIQTSNKKYYKKLFVPEIDRLQLLLEKSDISTDHMHQTFIIQYKKPQLMIEMEKEWYQELSKLEPCLPSDCKMQ